MQILVTITVNTPPLSLCNKQESVTFLGTLHALSTMYKIQAKEKMTFVNNLQNQHPNVQP